jgi:hypothetical protein
MSDVLKDSFYSDSDPEAIARWIERVLEDRAESADPEADDGEA